jgi:hypothetical protein
MGGQGGVSLGGGPLVEAIADTLSAAGGPVIAVPADPVTAGTVGSTTQEGTGSGAVTGVNLGILAAKGSLFVTRPTLATHVVPRSRLEASSEELFEMMASGKIELNRKMPLLP